MSIIQTYLIMKDNFYDPISLFIKFNWEVNGEWWKHWYMSDAQQHKAQARHKNTTLTHEASKDKRKEKKITAMHFTLHKVKTQTTAPAVNLDPGHIVPYERCNLTVEKLGG